MRVLQFSIAAATVLGAIGAAPLTFAGVVIDMPAPRKASRVNVMAAAANAASQANRYEYDVGELALARYGGAREGTYDNYYVMPYRNYSYPWPYGWGVYGWPWWGFGWGCGSVCAPRGGCK